MIISESVFVCPHDIWCVHKLSLDCLYWVSRQLVSWTLIPNLSQGSEIKLFVLDIKAACQLSLDS